MKFWFILPLAMLMFSPIWLERADFGWDATAEGSVGTPPSYAEGSVGTPPSYAEGSVGTPPSYAEGSVGTPPR